MSAALDRDFEQLLIEKVGSFEKLELLVLAYRDRRPWSRADASARLRVDETLVDVGLQELEAAGLLARSIDGYRFAPTSERLDRAADRLCTLYEEDRLRVVNLLTHAAFERIRRSAATVFADAFRIRKAPPDDPEGGDRG